VAMTLEKNMPIGSGLGSSACSVVAALVAMNEFCGRPLSESKMLALMGELEGRISGSVHYDNVAPCYLGGIQLMLEENGIISQSIPAFDDWLWVLAYPGIKVSTAEARAILPAQYRRQDCIAHGRHLAGFIHACYSRQPQLAAKLMKDVVAEPYRTRLLPGFAQARQGVRKSARWPAASPAPARRCSPCATIRKRRNEWQTGSQNTICKIRKASFIFAGWTRRAHA